MFNARIVVPTCKSRAEDSIATQISDIWMTAYFIDKEPFWSCNPLSASQNRNICLDQCSEGGIVIMVDDDITNFTEMWDLRLIKPLLDDPDIVLVSARLMNADGTYQQVMGGVCAPKEGLASVDLCPSACIAFRKDEIRFDEKYIGSGWEDTDFCLELKRVYPNGKFVINNDVKLTHLNEAKNQKSDIYLKNRIYFNKKWDRHE